MSWNCIDDDYDYYADYAVDAVADKIDQLARKLAMASGEDGLSGHFLRWRASQDLLHKSGEL